MHEIVIDREGIVWVPEIGGTPRTREYRLLGFNPATERWQHQIVADPDDEIGNPNKIGMHGSTIDSAGNLYTNWFGHGAIGRWERATGKITERVLRGLEHVRPEFDALDPPDPLTTRELEVLRLMAGGYSNREISDALGIAEGTVKNHASSVLSKLGVPDRTRAVLKALELGYLGG